MSYIGKLVSSDLTTVYLFPGQEGRAGMATVTLSEAQRFDPADVFKHVVSFLPAYARPCFLRIQVFLL